MCWTICSLGQRHSEEVALAMLSGGGEVTMYGVLPALLAGDEEQDGMKMGEEE